jgi:hypothetical protein
VLVAQRAPWHEFAGALVRNGARGQQDSRESVEVALNAAPRLCTVKVREVGPVRVRAHIAKCPRSIKRGRCRGDTVQAIGPGTTAKHELWQRVTRPGIGFLLLPVAAYAVVPKTGRGGAPALPREIDAIPIPTATVLTVRLAGRPVTSRHQPSSRAARSATGGGFPKAPGFVRSSRGPATQGQLVFPCAQQNGSESGGHEDPCSAMSRCYCTSRPQCSTPQLMVLRAGPGRCPGARPPWQQ